MSHAREAAETREAIENALRVLEDCIEFEEDTTGLQYAGRKRFWQPTGEGGAAIEGLKLILDRLVSRGN